MSNHQKRYRLGYALAPKKVDTFIQPSLITCASQHGIDLIQIDLSKPLIEQGPFDCVVHKKYESDWKLQLKLFSLEKPNVPIIDPPHCIERLHDRVSMLEVVGKLKLGKRSEFVEAPKQVVFSDSENLMGNDLIGKLGFPLIAKPVVSDGSAKSHQLYLVFDTEGLERLETPVILQEFVNHSGVVFKVYVAGKFVQCVKRKSLPDVSEEQLATLKGLQPFSQLSNLAVEEKGCDGFEGVEMPPSDFVEEIAKAIKEETGLNLINFDVIRDVRDAMRYLVIDINYFPGYGKIPNYECMLTNFFMDVLQKESLELVVGNSEKGEKASNIGI